MFFRRKKEALPSKAVNPAVVSSSLTKQLDDAWAVIRSERTKRRDLEDRVKRLERAKSSEAVSVSRVKTLLEKQEAKTQLPPLEAGKPYPVELLRKK